MAGSFFRAPRILGAGRRVLIPVIMEDDSGLNGGKWRGLVLGQTVGFVSSP